jgi:hypothetical protein
MTRPFGSDELKLAKPDMKEKNYKFWVLAPFWPLISVGGRLSKLYMTTRPPFKMTAVTEIEIAVYCCFIVSQNDLCGAFIFNQS